MFREMNDKIRFYCVGSAVSSSVQVPKYFFCGGAPSFISLLAELAFPPRISSCNGRTARCRRIKGC